MRIADEIRYDAAPTEVAAMLADPDFVLAKCELMGSVEHEASVEGDPERAFTVTSIRTLPTHDFPDVARKFVGDTVMIKQVDTWRAPGSDGTREGTVTLKIVGQPIRLAGSMSLRSADGGTVETIDSELKASVPLLGGKLEKAAEPAIRSAIRKEQEAGRTYLTG